jgi:hypothetical protein
MRLCGRSPCLFDSCRAEISTLLNGWASPRPPPPRPRPPLLPALFRHEQSRRWKGLSLNNNKRRRGTIDSPSFSPSYSHLLSLALSLSRSLALSLRTSYFPQFISPPPNNNLKVRLPPINPNLPIPPIPSFPYRNLQAPSRTKRSPL